MVAQDYMTTSILVSPVERSPKVTIHKNYNFEAYSPINDEYWDRKFAADLDTDSNASYAHMPMVGKWADKHWRDNIDSSIVILGNRGPAHGQRDYRSHTCDPHGHWSGNVTFADNHVEFWRDPTNPDFRDPKDNIFEEDKNILAFTKAIEEDKAVLQWD